MQTIVLVPVSSHERDDEFGGLLVGGKRSQAVDDLMLDIAGF